MKIRSHWLLRGLASLIMVVGAGPALAEKLVFDHRLSPALKQVLDGGDAAMIDYDAANPRNVVDTIAVRGRSAKDWEEALVIIARTPDRTIRTAGDWQAQLARESSARCPSDFASLAQDANSQTVERRSKGCPQGYPIQALYRSVAGKRSLFLLAVLAKDGIAPEAREQWLKLLASAHLE